MKKTRGEREGFTFIIIILILAVISILGLAILDTTTSTFKMTKIDSKSQSTYYIAEAGINQTINEIGKKVNKLSEEILSHDEFFILLDEYISKDLNLTLDKFEENSGEKPLAKITVSNKGIVKDEEKEDKNERSMSYKIDSRGNIGNLKRDLTTTIEITHGIEKEVTEVHHPAFDYVIYNGGDKTFTNAGGAIIDGSVYAKDVEFSAHGTKINGSIISEKSINLMSAVEINGDTYAMNGQTNLSNSNITINGNIHSSGNVTLSHGTTLNGNLYTYGETELESSNVNISGDIHAAKSVKLGSSSKVDNVYSGEDIELSSSASLNGELHGKGNLNFGPGAETKNIFLGGNIEFSSNNTINGNINASGYVGSTDKGTSLKLNGNIISNNKVITKSDQNYKIFGDIHARGNIENGEGNNISGNAVSGNQVINRGVIGGNITQNGNPALAKEPLSPKAPNFDKYKTLHSKVPLKVYEPGTKDIKAQNNSTTHNVLPGTYKNLTTKWNDTIQLTGGDYYFNSFNASTSAIKLKLDLSNGPINIYSKEDITFASGLEVYVSEDGKTYFKIDKNFVEKNKTKVIELASKIYWETYSNFKLNEDYCFLGTILTNKGISTSSSITLIGSYVSNEGTISMGYAPTLIYSPPSDVSSGNNGGDGNNKDGDKGENTIVPNLRIKITKPIKESR